MDARRDLTARGRRTVLAFACVAVAAAVFASPVHARMDESDRQRLRQDLRQQERARAERWQRQPDAPSEPADSNRERPRLTPEERQQLREQLRQRQHGGRR